MTIGVKCPKCGMMQMPGATCKSCKAPLGRPGPGPSAAQDPRGNGSHAPTRAARLELAADFPEVREIQRPEKYDLTAIFPHREGYGARKAVRRKIGLLTRLSPLLARILGEQERVLFVCRGIIQYLPEIILGNGYLTYYHNMHALVFTDQRIIFINITRAGQPKHRVHQIRYGKIKSWKGPNTMVSAVVVKLEDGIKLTLVHIPRKDARLAKQLVDRVQAAAAAESMPATAEAFQNLCPSCFAEIPKGVYHCSRCQIDFKTPKKAALRSLLLPGLGDIYLTHRFLGTMELLGSALLVLLLIASLFWGDSGEAMVFLILIFFYHPMDAALTYHMGKKGLIPER